MNQPNLSVMAPKTAAPQPESPDVLALVKRYAWLLIAGAVVGAGASGGYYAYAARYQSEYTARIPFQVLPPPPPIGSEGSTNSMILQQDDTSQVVHRQEFIFQQDGFLNEVLKSAAFHPTNPDGSNGECAWLAEHKTDTLRYLRRDLTVVPRINAASFEVTMTTRDQMESYNLVNAAVKVYMQRLQSDSARRRTAFLRNLGDAVKKAEDNLQIKSDALVDYQKRKGIDVLQSRFEIEKNALQGLNDDFTRADAAASSAEQQAKALDANRPKPDAFVAELKIPAGWRAIFDTQETVAPYGMVAGKGREVRLVPENGEPKSKPLTIWIMDSDYQGGAAPTAAPLSGYPKEWDTWNDYRVYVYLDGDQAWEDAVKEVQRALKASSAGTFALSSELQQSVEMDNRLLTLANQRLLWEQEKAAELRKVNPFKQNLDMIDGRLAEIDKQTDAMRQKLTDDARIRMKKMLRDEAANKRYLANYIGQIRTTKENIVTGIGQELLVWQQRVSDLKEQSDLVTKLRSQYNLAQANQATDDTRVSQIDDPVIPLIPSWPKWYMFIPLGTIAGLGLSALLAYLFVLTDTRVRTPRDIARTLQLPVLGFVPDEHDDRMLTGDVETAILSSPASMVAEAFRQIRGAITAQTAHNPVNTLAVSSIGPGGGSTTVASNLAAAMALNDLRVLLVDANFYRPTLNRIYKSLPKEGLTDAVADPSTVDACIMPHPSLARLHIMGAGTQLAGASSEVFESKSFREILENLKSKYDMVIFDGAPLNLVSDSLALAARVDGVVSVVRAGEVSRGAVSRVRDQIRSVHGNLLGFILNAAQTSNTGYFKENYRSFYRYAGKSSRAQAK